MHIAFFAVCAVLFAPAQAVAAAPGNFDFLTSGAILFALALAILPLVDLLGLPSATGYVVGGVIVGPSLFGVFAGADFLYFAEFGVVIALFILFLEIDFERFWRVLARYLPHYVVRFLIVGAAVFCVARFGLLLPWREALVLAMAASLASAAMIEAAIRTRALHNEAIKDSLRVHAALEGATILLILFVITFLAAPDHSVSSGAPAWVLVAQPAAALAGVALATWWFSRYGVRYLILPEHPESGLFAVFAIVMGAALVGDLAGIGMAPAAIVAALVLAGSRIRNSLRERIAPFRDILMGLFFLSVGMTLDLAMVFDSGVADLAAAAAALLVCFAGSWLAARAFGFEGAAARRLALATGNPGEFGFVIVATAISVGVLAPATGALASAVIALGFVFSPIALLKRNRDGGRLKAFISYSKKDLATAQVLTSALARRDLDVSIDIRDLPFGEQWRLELGSMIDRADVVVFLASENSIQSQWCAWEVARAEQAKKRIFPVRLDATTPDQAPQALAAYQFFPASGPLDVADRRMLDDLALHLAANTAWLKISSRLYEAAEIWVREARHDDYLLRGRQLREVELWLAEGVARREAIHASVRDLIEASRAAARTEAQGPSADG